jgi:hypothetical protein
MYLATRRELLFDDASTKIMWIDPSPTQRGCVTRVVLDNLPGVL